MTRLALSLAFLVFALGCATPVGIRRASLSEPATPPSTPLNPYDARTQLVLGIYDRGIAKGLALTDSSRGIELDPSPRQAQIPFGTFDLSVHDEEFRYGGYRIVHPVALGDLKIRGLRNRYWRLGADAIGRGFALVSPHADPARALGPELEALFASIGGVTAHVAPDGSVADLTGSYTRWFGERGAAVALQRPDYAVFGTAATVEGALELVAA